MIDKLLQRKADLHAGVDFLMQGAEQESRDLRDDEFAKITEASTEIRKIDERVEELRDLESRREKAVEGDKSEDRNTERKPAVVTREERVYSPRSDASFFADAFRSIQGNPAARQRLERHAREVEVEGEGLEQRDVGTSGFGGLVVPQYLVEEFSEVLRNGRAFLNACRRMPLPAEGMSLIVPRGQTGSTVAAQATENSAVSETNVDFDNDLTVSVRTYSGQQDVSRQSLERGTPGLDRLVYADLVADYATKVDVAAISSDGTSGTHKGVLSATGINAVTYTDATPTVAEAWVKLADARRQVGKNRKLAANLWVMTTTRWAWFTAALDSQNRPLIIDNPSAAVNAMGVSNAENFGEGQLVGTLMGIPVLCDDNIPENLGAGTNEDRILCVRRQDSIIWEEGDGTPRELRFEDVGSASLTVKLLVYGYSAFTAERFPVAKSVISGTGLIAPTF